MLTLSRLDRREGAALVRQVVGNDALANGVVEAIVERTDGVPLFVEELSKALVESDAPLGAASGAQWSIAIPTTLQASLMARLDRLPQGKHVARIGAVIGRVFPHALLAEVCNVPEAQLGQGLRELVAAGLMNVHGVPPEATYTFKHVLVRDTAYESLLRRTRQQLHAKIADALETHFPELLDSQPEIFAQHYTEAGLVEKSVAFWAKAGDRSIARSAMGEAAAQFQKGLDQLAALPDRPERQRQELEFCSALGAALMAVKGFAAPETGHVYARARGLWEQLGFPSEFLDRKSTRLNSSHSGESRMPSSA